MNLETIIRDLPQHLGQRPFVAQEAVPERTGEASEASQAQARISLASLSRIRF